MCVFKTRELARLLDTFVESKVESRSYLLFCHYLKQFQQLCASNLAAVLILKTHGSQEITISNMAMFKEHRHLEIFSSLCCEGQNH